MSFPIQRAGICSLAFKQLKWEDPIVLFPIRWSSPCLEIAFRTEDLASRFLAYVKGDPTLEEWAWGDFATDLPHRLAVIPSFPVRNLNLPPSPNLRGRTIVLLPQRGCEASFHARLLEWVQRVYGEGVEKQIRYPDQRRCLTPVVVLFSALAVVLGIFWVALEGVASESVKNLR